MQKLNLPTLRQVFWEDRWNPRNQGFTGQRIIEDGTGMDKKELISTMREKTNLKEKDCEAAFNAFLDVAASQLQNYGNNKDNNPGSEMIRGMASPSPAK